MKRASSVQRVGDAPPQPQSAHTPTSDGGASPTAMMNALLPAGGGDGSAAEPPEWQLPGDIKQWMRVTPWITAAALLELTYQPQSIGSDAAIAPGSTVGSVEELPSEVATMVHAMLAQCNGCLHRGRTCPSFLIRGSRMYYSDSSAQCPACSQTKVSRGRVNKAVWQEISAAESEALARHTFALALYPTTQLGSLTHLVRHTALKELRIGDGEMLRAVLVRAAGHNHLTQLTALYLDGCTLADSDLMMLRGVTGQLTRLSVTRVTGLDSLSAISRDLVSLTSLDISETRFADYQWLDDIAQHGKLRALHAFGSFPARQIDRVAKLHSLEFLGMQLARYDNSHTNESTGKTRVFYPLQSFDRHPNLRRIVFPLDSVGWHGPMVEADVQLRRDCILYGFRKSGDSKRKFFGARVAQFSFSNSRALPYWRHIAYKTAYDHHQHTLAYVGLSEVDFTAILADASGDPVTHASTVWMHQSKDVLRMNARREAHGNVAPLFAERPKREVTVKEEPQRDENPRRQGKVAVKNEPTEDYRAMPLTAVHDPNRVPSSREPQLQQQQTTDYYDARHLTMKALNEEFGRSVWYAKYEEVNSRRDGRKDLAAMLETVRRELREEAAARAVPRAPQAQPTSTSPFTAQQQSQPVAQPVAQPAAPPRRSSSIMDMFAKAARKQQEAKQNR